MTTELRCEQNQLFGILSEDGKALEVRCRRRGCGYRPGVVILHTISLETGETIKTQRFKQPQREKE